MTIQEICELLKSELLNNGYKYGFYLDGKIYLPDMSDCFDKNFFELLLTKYRVQAPGDTKKAKVGTCHDIAVLMKYLLDRQNVPNKIWLLHDKTRSRFHTILTFEAENKTVYLELTPQSSKPCYGKEIIFDNEQEFIAQYIQNNFDITDVTDSIIVGDAPDFVLSRMA